MVSSSMGWLSPPSIAAPAPRTPLYSRYFMRPLKCLWASQAISMFSRKSWCHWYMSLENLGASCLLNCLMLAMTIPIWVLKESSLGAAQAPESSGPHTTSSLLSS